MLSQCANPGCTNRFRFLHDGKVFVLDCGPNTASEKFDEGWKAASRRIEAFWLCAECARSWTVKFDGKRAVTSPVSGSANSLGYSSQKVA
jgi:hypothetical protein